MSMVRSLILLAGPTVSGTRALRGRRRVIRQATGTSERAPERKNFPWEAGHFFRFSLAYIVGRIHQDKRRLDRQAENRFVGVRNGGHAHAKGPPIPAPTEDLQPTARPLISYGSTAPKKASDLGTGPLAEIDPAPF